MIIEESIGTTQPTRSQASPHMPRIKVMGLGGGGCNAVDRMLEFGLTGVEFIAANTDRQALINNQAPLKIQLGPQLTRGLGAGGRPEVGRQAAEESREEIRRALLGADMVFLTAGMGGGTGTGAAAVAAEVAREMEILSIAVVTRPFAFEGGTRQRNAQEGLSWLQPHVDTLITIPNERLLQTVAPTATFLEAFLLADDVLRQAVQSITELITEPGTINVDFAHIHRLMKLGGGALMSIGQGTGENKATKAVQQALFHPLLEDIPLESASGMIVNFTAGDDLSLSEVGEALAYLQEQTSGDVDLVFGTTYKPERRNQVQANLVVTGLGATTIEEAFSSVQRKRKQAAVDEQERIIIRRLNVPEEKSEKEENRTQSPARIQDLDVPAFLRRRNFSTSNS